MILYFSYSFDYVVLFQCDISWPHPQILPAGMQMYVLYHCMMEGCDLVLLNEKYTP